MNNYKKFKINKLQFYKVNSLPFTPRDVYGVMQKTFSFHVLERGGTAEKTYLDLNTNNRRYEFLLPTTEAPQIWSTNPLPNN